MDWVQFKAWLSEITDLDQDALHIYAALMLQFGTGLLMRRSIARFAPWLVTLVVLVANESVDLFAPGEEILEWQVLGGLRDLWNTMAMPTLLLLLARYAPWLMRECPAPGFTESPEMSVNRLEEAENL